MRRVGTWSSLRWVMIPPALGVAVLSWVTRWSLWVVFPVGIAVGLVPVLLTLAVLGWVMQRAASPKRSQEDRTGI